MIVSDISAELSAAFNGASIFHLRQLEKLGVPWRVCAELGLNRWGVIRATDAGDGLYHPGDGDLHLVLPVLEDGELVDLVAFRSANPTEWLLRTGVGWALGLDRGLERHTWADAPLAVSPLEWLQQGAIGLCVLDWQAPEVRYLNEVSRLVCSSGELAKVLRAALTVPVRMPEISVGEPLRHAA